MTEDSEVPLHEFLAAERRSVGLSQVEAAKRMGLGLTTIARWEQGAAIPTSRNLARAFEIYETDLSAAPHLSPQKRIDVRIELLEQRLAELQQLVAGLVRQLEEREITSGTHTQPGA